MILGFFPPNSKDNFLNIGAAILAMFAPVLVPPVKEINGTSLWLTIALPTLWPKPCTIFKTPFGKPALMQISESK